MLVCHESSMALEEKVREQDFICICLLLAMEEEMKENREIPENWNVVRLKNEILSELKQLYNREKFKQQNSN